MVAKPRQLRQLRHEDHLAFVRLRDCLRTCAFGTRVFGTAPSGGLWAYACGTALTACTMTEPMPTEPTQPTQPTRPPMFEEMQQLVVERNAQLAAAGTEMANMRAAIDTLQAEAAARTRTSIKLPKPEKFMGSGSPQLVEWLYVVRDYVARGGVPAEEQVSHAVHYLGGAAFTWWAQVSQRPGVTWTFEKFSTDLRRVFCPADDAEMARVL